MPKPSEAARRAAEELILLVPRVSRIVRRYADSSYDKFRLTMPQYMALRSSRRRPQRMSHMADRLMLSKQTVSQTVDGLVADGLATRAEDPRDRRHTVVSITSAGEERLDVFEAAFAQYLSTSIDCMAPPELEALTLALAALNRTIVQLRDEGYFRPLAAHGNGVERPGR
ncbi:MAG: MarR family transcriptional regulator [Actinobacteria bacterium]|nr:MarR family transcriptional regulator [Actinomycetota bacterium]